MLKVLFMVLLLYIGQSSSWYDESTEQKDEKSLIIIAKGLDSEQLLRQNIINNIKLKMNYSNRKGSYIPDDIDRLYYYEEDKYGREIYSKWLYNLKDVAILFRDRFNIQFEFDKK